VARNTRARHTRFTGTPGGTYAFRVRARDRAGNVSRYAYVRSVIPFDDRTTRLVYSGDWESYGEEHAYFRTLRRTRKAGAGTRMRFRGRRVAIIGRKLPRGGRIEVVVDGRRSVRNLRGMAKPRRVLFTSRLLRPGSHTLRVRSLGGGPIDLDAFAVTA
jgi:hypothetical protein